MQINNLIHSIEDMSDEELTEYLRKLRHRRQVERPASADRKKRASSKGKTTRINTLESLLANLSESERAELLQTLGKANEKC